MPRPSRPHGNALRRGRYSEPGRTYLLTAATYHRQPIFTDWMIGRLLVHEFRRCAERSVNSLAWVVMPDHFHWLIALNNASLANVARTVKARSAQAIHASRGTSGQVWQRGYHDHALRKDEAVETVARYVVANPLRAGLVNRLGDYPLWDAVWLNDRAA